MKAVLLGVTVILFLMSWGCQKKMDTLPSSENPNHSIRPFKLNVFPDSSQTIKFTSPYAKSEITATKFNGHYIIDNDIILTEEQLNYLKSPKTNPALAIRSSGTGIKKNGAYIVPDPNGPFLNFWDKGVIWYVIDPNFSAAHQAVILQAMQDWENNVSGVDFRQRVSTSVNQFISFVPTVDVNASHIGRANTNGQAIYLGTANGPDLATAIHEIGHAMGLFHEQSRADRDNHISVVTTNIVPAKMHNFNTYLMNNYNGVDVGPFDFNSIMLYPSIISDVNFANNITLPVLTRHDGTTWGRNTSISAGDAETASQIFGAPYARLEVVNKYYDETYSGPTSSIYSLDDIYIKIYADQGCTIPYTGPRSITVRLVYTEHTLYSSSQQNFAITIPAGTNTYLVYSDLASRVYYADYGTPLYDESRSYAPRSSNFR